MHPISRSILLLCAAALPAAACHRALRPSPPAASAPYATVGPDSTRTPEECAAVVERVRRAGTAATKQDTVYPAQAAAPWVPPYPPPSSQRGKVATLWIPVSERAAA